jgi:hypothetical protein
MQNLWDGILVSASACMAYNVSDITDNWTMLDGWQTTSYNLYDYQGKIVLVNLFKDT